VAVIAPKTTPWVRVWGGGEKNIIIIIINDSIYFILP